MTIERGHRERFLASIVIAGLVLTGCGPNRAEWMARAAKNQATSATAPIGSLQQVRLEAGQASAVLTRLVGTIGANADRYSPAEKAVYFPLAQYAATVSSVLQAISASRTDDEFTKAVFAMCGPALKDAEPRVGRVMLNIGGAIEAGQIGTGLTEQQGTGAANYYETFGNRLVGIPAQCDQAESAMAEASSAEQNAEAQHQVNVTRALTMATVLFVGTAMLAGEIGAAAATRPPVQNNYMYVNQYNGY